MLILSQLMFINSHHHDAMERTGNKTFTILSSKVHHQFLSDVFQAEVHVEHDQFTLPFLERQIYSSDCDLDWWCLKRKVICPSLWTIIPQLRVYNRYSNGTIANRWLCLKLEIKRKLPVNTYATLTMDNFIENPTFIHKIRILSLLKLNHHARNISCKPNDMYE